jgi:Domain of unknown function (DUF2017)
VGDLAEGGRVKRFRGRRRGGAHAEFEQPEARLIANLAAQVAELLGSDSGAAESDDPLAGLVDIDGSTQPPDDPVLRRLLPDAYRDDDEGAADFRRFTERGLREAKSRNAQILIESLIAGGMSEPIAADAEGDVEAPAEPQVEVELDADGVQAWLRALTDIRLALATRLGIEQDDEQRWTRLPEDDPETCVHDIYDWLGYVQETLVHAVD